MINYADRMEQEARLMGGLSDWMEKHGEVLSDRSRSNYYTGVRILEVRWRGADWRIIEVYGMTCRIERM